MDSSQMDFVKQPLPAQYDVAVIGGALSGAATALLLLRKNPGIRILIIEKNEQLGRRVGEATVEVSAYFLGRVLGMTQYLNEAHICKQGLRFYFTNDKVRTLEDASEIGPRYLARLPSYQLDRSTFDEEVLRRAEDLGAEIWRPAKVSSVELLAGGSQKILLNYEGKEREILARWVVDASGLAAILARKNGWWRANEAHPTAAAWSRWTGVKDWDGEALAKKFPAWAQACYGTRGTATNHIIGDGWWSWWIPLKGGDMSVGIVWDQRLTAFPQEGGKLGERLKTFLMQHPVAREILAEASYVEEDMHWRKNLAYYSTTFAGDGYILVGDAAGFLDPFYSPGMDWISFTASGAADVITKQRTGKHIDFEKYNSDLANSYHRWFVALYKDKYQYMGECDLLALAFRLDLSLYYWGVVEPVFRMGEEAYLAPPFSPPSGKFFSALMRTYNSRFAKIARRRRALGLLGQHNNGYRSMIPGFVLERKDTLRFPGMLKDWLKLELTEGWHTWRKF